MKVKFHLKKENNPQSNDGVKVVYGKAKRGGYRLRWYLILALVVSPVIFLAYLFFRNNILTISPAIVTSNPVTITAKTAGTVGPTPVKIGVLVNENQAVIQLNNLEIEEQISFLESELLKLIEVPIDIDSLHLNGITETRRSLDKILQIQHRYEEYREKGQVSEVDYTSIVGISNSLNNQLNNQLIAYNEAKRDRKERNLAGAVSQSRRLLMQDLVLKRTLERELTITSPYDGRVVDIHVVEGQRVQEGDELITISRNTVPHIVAYLNPKYLDLAKQEKKVKVRFPDGTSYDAMVSKSVEVVSKLPSQLVSPFEGQPAFLKVNLDLITEPRQEHWVEGMTVEVRF
ncbi:HlyD family efflux transporter periplasmic adaptor subunit [Vibrio lamellibrachiae]|uniref:HlyD family secretion protein n=1 Tax=Vibrio lamellibrachiae TaxID=2910253 RepID=UPI003D0D5AE1